MTFSAAEAVAWRQQWVKPSLDYRLRIHRLDTAHRFLSSIEQIALDGQVNIDAGTNDTPDRTLQIGFVDPDRRLSVPAEAPGSIHPGRFLLVQVGLWVESLDRRLWADVGMFRPVGLPKRDGDVITVLAQDKSSLFFRGIPVKTYKAGSYVVDVIKAELARAGETHYSVPGPSVMGRKLSKPVSIGGGDPAFYPWPRMRSLASSMGAHLFYDRSGWCRLRWAPTAAHPATSRWPAELVTSDVSLQPTNDELIVNRVNAPGAKKIVGIAKLPSWHPMSAFALRVGAVPWESGHTLERDESLNTQAKANARAAQQLGRMSAESLDVSFSGAPDYLIEPRDIGTVETPTDGDMAFGVLKASLPLANQEDATYGFHRTVRTLRSGRMVNL